MESENSFCGVCFIPYDANHRIPRVLINCGHTLCSSCLTEILKSPQLQKCPFDNLEFERAQRCLENFPVNFALLALLEESNKNLCQAHNEPLIMVCLKDQIKICADCAVFGEHNGHPMKKIKDLKANGMKMKKDLEQGLAKFEKFQLEKDQEMERKRKECLTKVKSKFEEIRNILGRKESEWEEKIDNLFERNIRNDRLLLKKEAEETIKEIDQAVQKEKNLIILDQDFSPIISRLQPQVSKEETWKFPDDTSRMTDCMESFLMGQVKSIQNFDLLSERTKPEQIIVKKKEPEDFDETSLISDKIKAKTRLTLRKRKKSIFLDMKNPDPVYQTIDLDEIYYLRILNVELERYHDLLSELTIDFILLSEILKKLHYYNSFKVVFTPLGLNDDHVYILFDHLFCRIQFLSKIEISFEGCKITDKSIFSFCDDILPKAISLRNLTLRLGFTEVSNRGLFVLAETLSLLGQKLKSFTLAVDNTFVTDDGVEKIFQVIPRVKVLNLQLQGNLITDHSLKMLGNHMKNLEEFSLNVSNTLVTTEGVTVILRRISSEIKCLNLNFSHVKLSGQIAFLFEEQVWPKLELAEEVYVKVKEMDLAEKMPKSLRSIRKAAVRRKKLIGRIKKI